MNVKRVLTTTVCLVVFVICTSVSAYAGTFIIEVPRDSNVTLTVFFSDGTRRDFAVLGTRGPVRFDVPNQENVNRWLLQIVALDGPAFASLGNLTVPNSLPALEPFAIPTFSAANPEIVLASNVDVNAFVAAANPFSVGQTFSVVNGMTSLTSAIVFNDQRGNPFTGTVTVEPFYRVEPIPEPATMLLLGTGIAGMIIKIRKRRSLSQTRDTD
ncbi:MAG TPA: PEP-CTERM sorting domain-containing protein [Pyrinomonadaceae bacterium]|nr:PEP-CTERM sorting domain-containing protein [Pyrinomonadaceae bacterium]